MNAHTKNILAHAKRGGLFVFTAHGWDLTDPSEVSPVNGEVVRLAPENTGPTRGCPSQGTMDHVFVESPGGCDPVFYGLVSTASLTPLEDTVSPVEHLFIAGARELAVVDGRVRFTDETWESLSKAFIRQYLYDGPRLRQCFEDWLTEHYLTD